MVWILKFIASLILGFIFKNFIRKNGYDFVRMEITKSSWENIKKPQNETSSNYKK